MTFTVAIERETAGRWIAEIPELSGVLAYGSDRQQAISAVKALALRVLAERVERGADLDFVSFSFAT
jgi:predicted RNase H-like HicB family nuclease